MFRVRRNSMRKNWQQDWLENVKLRSHLRKGLVRQLQVGRRLEGKGKIEKLEKLRKRGQRRKLRRKHEKLLVPVPLKGIGLLKGLNKVTTREVHNIPMS